MINDDSTKKSAELKRKLITILEELLAKGDWENSLFLKNAKKRLLELKEEAIALDGDATTISTGAVSDAHEKMAEGMLKVYISLYQIDGNNLQNWSHTVKALAAYNVSRPTYINLADIRELINSKADIERHAYVTVKINKNDMIDIDPKPVDTLGHELLILKEGAVKAENILEFIHANKKRYSLNNGMLVYQGIVEI